MPSERPAPTPQHVRQAIQQITAMQVTHHREATGAERLTDRVISVLGTPTLLVCVAAFTSIWVAIGFAFPTSWVDAAPFPYLDLILSFSAILIAVLILASQRRDDR